MISFVAAVIALSVLPASAAFGQEASPGTAAADDNLRSILPNFHPSYVEIERPALGPSPKATLEGRLDHARGLAETEKLVQQALKDPQKYGLNADQIRTLREQRRLPGATQGLDLNDNNVWQLAEQVKRYLSAHPQAGPGSQLKPEDWERITKTLQQLKGGGLGRPPEPPSPDGPGDAGPLQSGGATEPSGEVTRPQGQPASGSSHGPAANPEAGDGAPSVNDKLARWLLKQMDQLKGADELLSESPELRQAVDDLAKYLAESRGAEDKTAGSYGPLSSLFRSAVQNVPLPNITWPDIGKLPLPPLPHAELPRVGWSWGSLPSPGVPHLGNPAVPGAEGGLALLQIAVVVAVAVVVWKVVLRRRWTGAAAGRDAAWRLGPSPVDPRTVSTREDLIRAFEHLSLLRLGPESRSWNHLDIAAGLGGAGPERRLAADRLAALYEHARYAPGSAPLADDEVRVARRELSFLAGVEPV